MPRPTGAPLVVACYAGRVADVRALLASGADPRAPSAEGDTPIFSCIHFGYANILEKLLATGQYDLVHQVQTSFNPCYVPPLFYLLYYWAKPDHPQLGWPGSDPLECVRLLMEAGASVDAVEAQRSLSDSEIVRHDAFEYAREIGNVDLLRMLEAAARLRYSPATHGRFPRPARYAAAELLRLGYQIGPGVLVPVWAEHVIPFLVSRTSRGAVPTLPRSVVFIEALSDEKVEAMLDGDYAEHATVEHQRRLDAKKARYVAIAARTLANHAVGMPMGPKAKRVNELVCECGGDLEEVARTDEETKELVREWISKISSYNGGAHLGTDSYFD